MSCLDHTVLKELPRVILFLRGEVRILTGLDLTEALAPSHASRTSDGTFPSSNHLGFSVRSQMFNWSASRFWPSSPKLPCEKTRTAICGPPPEPWVEVTKIVGQFSHSVRTLPQFQPWVPGKSSLLSSISSLEAFCWLFGLLSPGVFISRIHLGTSGLLSHLFYTLHIFFYLVSNLV